MEVPEGDPTAVFVATSMAARPLRRLVTAGALTGSDVEELAALCKAAHALVDKRESLPLEEHHIPRRGQAAWSYGYGRATEIGSFSSRRVAW